MEQVTVTTGQRVAFVMRDGTTRPLDIVRVWGDAHVSLNKPPRPGCCNGVLLIDGKNDEDNLPVIVGKDEKEQDVFQQLPIARQTVAHGDEYPICSIWVESTYYSEDKEPGTYHFAEDDADAVDVPELQSRVDELERIVRKLSSKQPKTQTETPATPEQEGNTKPDAAGKYSV
jgi:hypothetical protein